MIVKVGIGGGASGLAAHVEMVVVCLKDSKRCCKKRLVISDVRAVNNSIGILRKKLCAALGIVAVSAKRAEMSA